MAAPAVVPPSATVDGAVRIRDVSGKNTVLRVDVPGSREIVKATAEAEREWAVMTTLASDPFLAPHLPKPIEVSGQEIRIAAVDGRVLDHDTRAGTQPTPGVTAAIGAAIARLHSSTVSPRLPAACLPRPFADGWPWAGDLLPMSWAQREVIEVLQTAVVLSGSVDRVRNEWRASAPIHGDLRDQNVLTTGEDEHVVLIDWETGGVGDPAWDLASALGERLGTWITASASDPTALSAATAPELRIAVRALWDAYKNVSDADDEILERALRWVPVRLVQRALEDGAHRLRPSRVSLLTLQLAERLATSPERIREHVLDR